MISNAFVCMCIDLLLDKKTFKNQYWTARLVGYWVASSAAGHGSWALTSLLAKPPFLDINLLSHLIYTVANHKSQKHVL